VSADLRARIVAAIDADALCVEDWPFAKTARELLLLVLKEFDEFEADVSAEVQRADSACAEVDKLRAELRAVTAELDRLNNESAALALENVTLAAKARIISDIPETESRSSLALQLVAVTAERDLLRAAIRAYETGGRV
jgi:hypothetical protein